MQDNQATTINTEATAQIRKGRVPKLLRTEASFRPSRAAISVAPSTEVYALYFSTLCTGSIGTKEESEQVYDFAHQLDEQAKTVKVGNVQKVGVSDGSFEVMLRLDQPVGEVDAEALISNAFRSLEEFLTSATVLNTGSSRNRAAWKYKLNGSLLDKGDF